MARGCRLARRAGGGGMAVRDRGRTGAAAGRHGVAEPTFPALTGRIVDEAG